jgi:hypothetical protein
MPRARGATADLAVVALLAAAGLLIAGLFAPWASTKDGIQFFRDRSPDGIDLLPGVTSDEQFDGWGWLGGGADVALVALAATLVAVALLRRRRGAVPLPLLLAGGVAVVAALVAILVWGIDARDIRVERLSFLPDPARFSTSSHEGPVLTVAALALGLAGLVLGRRPARVSLALRAAVLLLAAAAVVVGLFARWQVHDWADVGIVAVAVAIALAAALPRHPALLALPLLAVALPFIEHGVSASPRGGFVDGGVIGIARSAVGPGAWLVIAALVLAAAALSPAPSRLRGRASPGARRPAAPHAG